MAVAKTCPGLSALEAIGQRSKNVAASRMGSPIRFRCALAASKLVRGVLRKTGHVGGQLPGVIAEKMDPDFLAHIPMPEHLVFVSGTNGKTTTTNLIADILFDNGRMLVTNRAGGNIGTGIASTLIANADAGGHPRADTAVMELDEICFNEVMPYVDPELVVVTNLYSDTFTRSANPDYVFSVMSRNISPDTRLVLNADDLISCRMAPQTKSRVYYAIAPQPEDTKEPQGIVCDLPACPVCGGSLEYDYAHFRHLGHARCTSCGYTNPEPDYVLTKIDHEKHLLTIEERCHEGSPAHEYYLQSLSITNAYNLLAAIVAVREMGLSAEEIAHSLEHGINITTERYQARSVCDRRIVTIASKGENGTATSVALQTVMSEPGTKALIMLLSDGHMAENADEVEYPGWLYLTDFELLDDPSVKEIVLVGATADEQALRLRLAGVPAEKITKVAGWEDAVNAVHPMEADATYIAFAVSNVGIASKAADALAKRIEEADGER